MPELPDVEGYRRLLGCAVGSAVRRVEVLDAGVLNGVTAKRLRNTLEGKRFAEPERHGKWLLARTRGGPVLMLHFGMTGQLLCSRAEEPPEPHDRVLFTLTRGRQLRYRDQRKLKGLWLADDDSEVARLLRDLGPDAAAMGSEEFDEALSSRRGRVKTVLTDQSVVAGLGNLLADEILWRARLRPDRLARDLTHAERRCLYTQMRRTLRSAITAGCVPPRDAWLTGHRDDPEPTCPRCHHALRRTRLAGRGTVWCPACQHDGDSGREAR